MGNEEEVNKEANRLVERINTLGEKCEAMQCSDEEWDELMESMNKLEEL
jgi:hypothetical protein